MKYLLMIYQNPDVWDALPQEDRLAAMNDAGRIMGELEQSGEWVGGEALADPRTARGVRVRNGHAVVTDGPYIESHEHLAGYLIVECETPERAVEIAASWPDARLFGMEVRALMHDSGADPGASA